MICWKCKCKERKVREVEFSVKARDENDTWLLCEKCNDKPVFKEHRVNEKRLGDSN